jgi:hypothetical protein
MDRYIIFMECTLRASSELCDLLPSFVSGPYVVLPEGLGTNVKTGQLYIHHPQLGVH